MDITLKANLRKRKADKNGLCPIGISIRGGGDEKYHYTQIKVLPGQWVDGKITTDAPNSDILNNRIKSLIAGVDRKILLMHAAGEEVTLEVVKGLFQPEGKDKSGDFHAFHSSYIKYLKSNFSPGYIKHLEVEQRQLKKYRPTLRFSDINDDFLEQYEMQLTCAATTKHTKMKRLKEVVDRAVAKGKIDGKKVATYKLPPYVEPEGQYLTLPQTEIIANAIYEGDLDFNANIKKVACYFLVECYSGIRFSDWHRFKIETLLRDRNFKVRAKKNKEPVYIPLNVFKRLGTIIDYIVANDIVFDLKERETNIMLKALPVVLKLPIQDLTTHVGRHTCGTLLGEMGYNDREIAEILGISEKTAKTYRKNTRQGLNNAFEKHGGL